MKHAIFPGRRQRQNFLSESSVSAAAFRQQVRLPAAEAGPRTFVNPILPAPAQDPQVALIGSRYHYCESSDEGIFLRVADDLLALGRAPRQRVWTPPRSGGCSRNVWAPELHVIDGRCHIYFAADDGDNARHRMWVLVSEGGPLGPYRMAGSLETGGWAIDGTVLTGTDGQRYFIWSGWPGRSDGRQNLYLSAMSDPLRLSGRRTLLAAPEHRWETRGMPICEGPQVLQRGHRTFVVYSASASWTADYCLGMLVHEGGDMLDPRRWRKVGQVFGRNQHTWGVGHCGFVSTPEGEDWILFHAKTRLRPGWADREVRAQKYSWSGDGFPDFGSPAASGRPLPR